VNPKPEQQAEFARRILEICRELQCLRKAKLVLDSDLQERERELQREIVKLDYKLFPDDQFFEEPKASSSWQFN
jgi:hypothetical protein